MSCLPAGFTVATHFPFGCRYIRVLEPGTTSSLRSMPSWLKASLNGPSLYRYAEGRPHLPLEAPDGDPHLLAAGLLVLVDHQDPPAPPGQECAAYQAAQAGAHDDDVDSLFLDIPKPPFLFAPRARNKGEAGQGTRIAWKDRPGMDGCLSGIA